ncbi:hypothetical protein ES708_32845 [subsurface metagenome]
MSIGVIINFNFFGIGLLVLIIQPVNSILLTFMKINSPFINKGGYTGLIHFSDNLFLLVSGIDYYKIIYRGTAQTYLLSGIDFAHPIPFLFHTMKYAFLL